MTNEEVMSLASELAEVIGGMGVDESIEALNAVREKLHEVSPFKNEPVDMVRWVKSGSVVANDYNPNKVAPPEMKLLELSIMNDGYTQPVVGWSDSDKGVEVVDGFHRSRVGKESKVVAKRVHGYLPTVDIRGDQSGKNDRMASTIRHNRARGKHQVGAMSEIVIELKNRNWRNARVARELGMDEEEVLRLCQISGLESLFSDQDFSRAWESDDSDSQWTDVTDTVEPSVIEDTRIPHKDKGNRIFHTFVKWECHKCGFYASSVKGKTKEECEAEYVNFFRDLPAFREAASKVVSLWKYSCEHYLTNFAMNRIAWIGQASICLERGIPSKFCSGFNQLSLEEQQAANEVALEALNTWLKANGREEVDLQTGLALGRQVETY